MGMGMNPSSDEMRKLISDTIASITPEEFEEGLGHSPVAGTLYRSTQNPGPPTPERTAAAIEEAKKQYTYATPDVPMTTLRDLRNAMATAALVSGKGPNYKAVHLRPDVYDALLEGARDLDGKPECNKISTLRGLPVFKREMEAPFWLEPIEGGSIAQQLKAGVTVRPGPNDRGGYTITGVR